MSDNSNAFTVIIGTNGCGKSELLKDTCNYYLELYAQTITSKNRNIFSAVHFAKEDIKHWSAIETEINHSLPRKLIAASSSQFEKFDAHWRHSSDFLVNGFYAYIGSKPYLPSLSPSVRIASKAVEQLLNIRSDTKRLKALSCFLTEFQFGPLLRLDFDLMIPSEDIRRIAESENFEHIGRDEATRMAIKRLHEEYEIQELVYLLNLCELVAHTPEMILRITTTDMELVSIDTNMGEFDITKRDVATLLRCGLISLKNISTVSTTPDHGFKKPVDDLVFRPLYKRSSGEQCLFLLFMGLISAIEDHALICIDEPEISLHPQWQERFVDIVNHAFVDYHSCHFLIATHSPLIVSDISATNCRVYDMVNRQLIDASPHRERSADYQLAKLFHNPGKNNEYLITQIIEVLDCVCKTENPPEETLAAANWLLSFEFKLEEHDKVRVLLGIMRSTLLAGGHL